MRYTNGTKNNDVTAVVRADAFDCPELRRSSSGSDGQCWIAVKSGQKISVFCDLKLEASQYQVDLVVDGVLRNIVVSTVCPRHEDHREEIVEFFEGNHKHHRSLFRSPMTTSRMPARKPGQEPLEFDDSDNTRVGTIEIIVYKYNMGYNHTRAAELPENVVDWEDLEGSAGCAGIEPTHEIVMETARRLNDTERRTWKNKSEKLPMGHKPWASFKFLYRHETALRDAQLINPRLNIVPAAAGLSDLKKGLLTFYTLPEDNGDDSNESRYTNNPWIVRERNGLREYKQLDVTPVEPGPQVVSTKRVPKRPRHDRKKGKKAATRRSSFVDDDDESKYEESDGGSSVAAPSKRLKPTLIISGLREEVKELETARDKARLELGKQRKLGNTYLNGKEERTILIAQKDALQREIAYLNLNVEKHKKRRAALKDLNDAPESGDDSEDDTMIDPAILTPEPSSPKAVRRSPVAGGHATQSSNDGSVSGGSVSDGAGILQDSNTSDDAFAMDNTTAATKEMDIVDHAMAYD